MARSSIRGKVSLPEQSSVEEKLDPESSRNSRVVVVKSDKRFETQLALREIRAMIRSSEVTQAEQSFRDHFENLLFDELVELLKRHQEKVPDFIPTEEELRFNTEISRVLTKIKLRLGMMSLEHHFGGPEIWKAMTDNELELVLAKFVNYCHDGSIEKRAFTRLCERDL